MDLDFELAKQKGISSPYAVGFMPYSVKDGRITVDYAAASRQLAMDAAASPPLTSARPPLCTPISIPASCRCSSALPTRLSFSRLIR